MLWAWARASSVSAARAFSVAFAPTSSNGTNSSKYPLLSASAGPNACDRITALSTAPGVSRNRSISIAARGIVNPIATSFAIHRYDPASGPTR